MEEQTWLITGGAGYIGSHIADVFLSSGKKVIILDSLSNGLQSRVEYLRSKAHKDIPLIIGDIRNSKIIEEVLKIYKPMGIVHTAALKSIPESIANPDVYMDVNYAATDQLVKLGLKFGIEKFIFSSTAAVYGAPEGAAHMKEDAKTNPISAYGGAKLLGEGVVSKFLDLPNKNGASLRYFNVIGTAAPELADNSKDNLLPKILDQIRKGISPVIYGKNYPTPDGTCIRDFVDVRDVAQAHLVIGDWPSKLPKVINLGTGTGVSVRELIDKVIALTENKWVTPVESLARFGDPAILCADVSLIRLKTGFASKYSIDESLISCIGTTNV